MSEVQERRQGDSGGGGEEGRAERSTGRRGPRMTSVECVDEHCSRRQEVLAAGDEVCKEPNESGRGSPLFLGKLERRCGDQWRISSGTQRTNSTGSQTTF